MSTRITLDPVTRLEGHLSVKAEVENGQVIDAYSSGTLYRGFENILLGRDPRDAMQVTQRICGVCPVSHGMASALALEAAWGMTVPDNARLIRNLILAANFVQSHILHFYHLSLLDFIDLPATPPWTPRYQLNSRFSQTQNDSLVQHYLAALTARRQAHDLGAVFGGKLPHTPVFEVGGVTAGPTAARIQLCRDLLAELTTFIEQCYLPDAALLAQTYPEYYYIGRGYGHLLAFGVFDLDPTGQNKLFRRGYALNGSTQVQSLDLAQIEEQVAYAWYAGASLPPTDTPPPDQPAAHRVFLPLIMGGRNGAPPASDNNGTTPDPDKAGAYSWLKAPRYGGLPAEVGPLARMWVNGDYRRGISVMDRHMARAQETHRLVLAMSSWLNKLQTNGSFYTNPTPRPSTDGIGLIEAPRGALGHWIEISNGQLSKYQIITPTCWNCSPRDAPGSPPRW